MRKFNAGHFFAFFLIIIVFLHFRGVGIQNEIEKDGKDIVVKFVKKKSYPKTTDFYFSYYFNDSLITTSGSGIKYDILNTKEETESINRLEINSYYLAKFNPKYPKNIIVNPNKKITDTLEIKKYGFIINKRTWQEELFSKD